jgi:hypothetical protein
MTLCRKLDKSVELNPVGADFQSVPRNSWRTLQTCAGKVRILCCRSYIDVLSTIRKTNQDKKYKQLFMQVNFYRSFLGD